MLSQINHLILDMDGVLWHGETPVPGLPEFFVTLDRLDIGYVMATNNATKTAEQYTEKLEALRHAYGRGTHPHLRRNNGRLS